MNPSGEVSACRHWLPRSPSSCCSSCSACCASRHGWRRSPRSASALLVALGAYGMPFQMAIISTLYGAAFGIFPIAWIVFSSIMLYRLAVDTGKFEIIKDSVGGLTNDRRLQAMFIAFSFGAFIEGAAGFGAPVAVSGAMLAGPGVLAVLRRRHLSARQHGAGGVRLDRHSHHDAGQRDGHPVDAAERDDRPALRDDLGHHSGVSDRRDGGPEARARSVAGDPDLRRLLCRHAVLRLELHRARAHRHPQLARVYFGDGAGAEILETADHHAAGRRQGSDARAEAALRQRSLRGLAAVPAAGRVRAHVGRSRHQGACSIGSAPRFCRDFCR